MNSNGFSTCDSLPFQNHSHMTDYRVPSHQCTFSAASPCSGRGGLTPQTHQTTDANSINLYPHIIYYPFQYKVHRPRRHTCRLPCSSEVKRPPTMLNQLKAQVTQYNNMPKSTTATVYTYVYTQHTYVCTYPHTHQDDSGVVAIVRLAYMQECTDPHP